MPFFTSVALFFFISSSLGLCQLSSFSRETFVFFARESSFLTHVIISPKNKLMTQNKLDFFISYFCFIFDITNVHDCFYHKFDFVI